MRHLKTTEARKGNDVPWRLKSREINMSSHETDKEYTKAKTPQRKVTVELSPQTVVSTLLVPTQCGLRPLKNRYCRI